MCFFLVVMGVCEDKRDLNIFSHKDAYALLCNDWLSQTASTPDIEIGIFYLESEKQEREKTAFIAVNWMCQRIVND